MSFYIDNNNYVRYDDKSTSSGGGSSEWDGEINALLILLGILLFTPMLLELIFGGHTFAYTLNIYGYVLSFIWSVICWFVWCIFHPHTIIYYLIFNKIFWFVLASIVLSFLAGIGTYLIAKQL
jgi:hypothetical protein